MCLSPLKLRVGIPQMARCTLYNIQHYVIEFVSDLQQRSSSFLISSSNACRLYIGIRLAGSLTGVSSFNLMKVEREDDQRRIPINAY
jgi:hypothetical protein